MGDDLFTGERSSVGSLSESHLSYYGEKIEPVERPPNRLTGFMSDQMANLEDENEKPKKMLVGYQPNKNEETISKKESKGFFGGFLSKNKPESG